MAVFFPVYDVIADQSNQTTVCGNLSTMYFHSYISSNIGGFVIVCHMMSLSKTNQIGRYLKILAETDHTRSRPHVGSR